MIKFGIWKPAFLDTLHPIPVHFCSLTSAFELFVPKLDQLIVESAEFRPVVGYAKIAVMAEKN